MRSAVCVTLPPELILEAKEYLKREKETIRSLSELVEKSLILQIYNR